MIYTNRLILRKFYESDIKSIFQIFHDDEVNKFLPWYKLDNIEEAKIFYNEKYKNYYENGGKLKFAICLKEDNIPIGYINIAENESFDLGYGLLTPYWNKGIVTEAGEAIIDLAKREGIPYITATHDINNSASGRVMKKLGLVYKYTYEELWMPKNYIVHFRMYQLNFDNSSFTYNKYWENSSVKFIEEIK